MTGGRPDGPIRKLTRRHGEPYLSEAGYLVQWVPGRGTIGVHRLVVEAHVGRRLKRHETVHHKNGDRVDNRLTNLELWSKSQPAGQRVIDKVRWAREILDLYGSDVEAGVIV